jgi:hypothetical protein
MKDLTISINLPVKDALRVIDFLSGNAPVAAAPTGIPATNDPGTPAVAPQFDPQIGVELDASGAPWNGECHSDSKGKDEAGLWKGRRGCTKEKRAAIEAQDRARLAGTPEPVAGPAPVTMAAPAAVPVTAAAPAMALPSFPAAAAPALPPIAQPVSYEQVVQKYADLSAAGKADANTFAAICQKTGVVNPAELTTNETLRAAVMAEFNLIG